MDSDKPSHANLWIKVGFLVVGTLLSLIGTLLLLLLSQQGRRLEFAETRISGAELDIKGLNKIQATMIANAEAQTRIIDGLFNRIEKSEVIIGAVMMEQQRRTAAVGAVESVRDSMLKMAERLIVIEETIKHQAEQTRRKIDANVAVE